MASADLCKSAEGKTLDSNQICDFCGRGTPEKYCRNCEDRLCKTCERGHRRNKYMTGHSVVDIAVPNFVHCEQHADHDLEFVCVNCKIIICERCREDHKIHKVLPVKDNLKSLQLLCSENIPELLQLGQYLENDKVKCIELVNKYAENHYILKRYKEDIVHMVSVKMCKLEDSVRQKRENLDAIIHNDHVGLEKLIEKTNLNVKLQSDIRTSNNLQSLLSGIQDSRRFIEHVKTMSSEYRLEEESLDINNILPDINMFEKLKSEIEDTIDKSQKHIERSPLVEHLNNKDKIHNQSIQPTEEEVLNNIKHDLEAMGLTVGTPEISTVDDIADFNKPHISNPEKNRDFPIGKNKQIVTIETMTVTEEIGEKLCEKQPNTAECHKSNNALHEKEDSKTTTAACDTGFANLKQHYRFERNKSRAGYLICESNAANQETVIIYEKDTNRIEKIHLGSLQTSTKTAAINIFKMIELEYKNTRTYITIHKDLNKIIVLNDTFESMENHTETSAGNFSYSSICCAKQSNEFFVTETHNRYPYQTIICVWKFLSTNAFEVKLVQTYQLLGTSSMVYLPSNLLLMVTAKPFAICRLHLNKKCFNRYDIANYGAKCGETIALLYSRNDEILIGYPNGHIKRFNSNLNSGKLILEVGKDMCALSSVNGKLIVTTMSSILIYK